MNGLKPWYLSKTMWGGLVAVAASLAGLAGVSIEPALEAEMTEAVLQAVSAVGAFLALIGRISATRRLR